MKKNVVKRLLGLSMAAVLTAGLLGGCGSDGGDGGNDGGSSSGGKGVTLT